MPNSLASKQATIILRLDVQYASLALLYYDYALTWTREVQYFWLRKPSFSTLLYFCCRYALFANVIYAIAINDQFQGRSCDVAVQICAALSVVGRFAILTVWGARTYAVFNRNKWILAVFSSLGLTVLVLSIMHVPYVSCTPTKEPLVGPQLLAVSTTVYEVSSAIFTTFRGYSDLRIGGKWRSQRKCLTYLIMKHGLLYYGFVSLFSVSSIILLNVKSLKGTFFERLLNALTIPVSGMMTARFLIHLRVWEQSTFAGSTESKTRSIHDIRFNVSQHDSSEADVRQLEFWNDPLLEAPR